MVNQITLITVENIFIQQIVKEDTVKYRERLKVGTIRTREVECSGLNVNNKVDNNFDSQLLSGTLQVA